MCGGSKTTWWTASSSAPRGTTAPWGGEVRHIRQCAADDDMAAKCAAFRQAIKRVRRLTEGRKHTPAEVLIRENHGHRDTV